MTPVAKYPRVPALVFADTVSGITVIYLVSALACGQDTFTSPDLSLAGMHTSVTVEECRVEPTGASDDDVSGVGMSVVTFEPGPSPVVESVWVS